MSSCRFSAVVFDLGGVMVDWNPHHLYRSLIPDDDERERFLTEICNPAWNHSLDRGHDPREAIPELVRRHPDQADLINAWWDRWPEMLSGEIPGTRELATRLHREGVPIYALTNWSQHTWPRATGRYPFLLELFDGIVVSGQEGVAKPEREIFEILASRYRLDVSTTAFTDDMPANVEVASQLGFRTHLFVDADLLEHWLYQG